MRKPGYIRCLYRSNGIQCEEWYQDNGAKYCNVHESLGLKYIEVVNEQRKYCYQIFKDIQNPTLEEFQELDAHLDALNLELEKQKTLISTAKAVRGELTEHLSEADRKERLKYKVKKQEPKEKKAKAAKKKRAADDSPTIKKDPLAFFAKKGISPEKASELLNADPDELIKKFQERKNARVSKEEANSPNSSGV